jgi:hypothetical protein
LAEAGSVNPVFAWPQLLGDDFDPAATVEEEPTELYRRRVLGMTFEDVPHAGGVDGDGTPFSSRPLQPDVRPRGPTTLLTIRQM